MALIIRISPEVEGGASVIAVKAGKIFVDELTFKALSIFVAPQPVIGFGSEAKLGDYVILDTIVIPRRFELKGKDEALWVNVVTKKVKYGLIEETVWFADAPDLLELAADPSAAASRKLDSLGLAKLMELFKDVAKLVREGRLLIERWGIIEKASNVKVWGMPAREGFLRGVPSGYVSELKEDSELAGYVATEIAPAPRT